LRRSFPSLPSGSLWQRISLTHGARRNAAQALHALTPPAARTHPKRHQSVGVTAAEAHEPGDEAGAEDAEQSTAASQQIAHLDSAGFVVAANIGWRESVEAGNPITAGIGVNYLDYCELSAANGARLAAEAALLTRDALSGLDTHRKIVYAIGDSWFSLQVLGLPAGDCGAVAILEDITARRELEQELRHRAFHDPLTSLPNRALLADRLEHAVAGAARETRSLAVLFIDLDDFKSVNDRLGHLAGDAALCEAARRLAGCVRTSDTVGRWGGDEFVVIAERLDISVTADVLASRIAERLREPMKIADRELEIHASIGVAVLDDHKTADQLVEAADRALIAARNERPNAHGRRGSRRSIGEAMAGAIGAEGGLPAS
jgi:diguanylate cyclase (GGDEF)-like protein